ncbi:PEPxxWA-CTERM sorting domain-containing protein [Sandarakinorhabdus sp.]|uniref:PEPxxWA-CTERM sorting domain-containing protein n=1 Tax=Sandarakinorhabdus sp. TaxID=1916663 RepID=UPI00286E8470|nr:PEPxxWA-CTERM sorting domain-containing protein [Sandarakinorhabdus sp.]
MSITSRLLPLAALVATLAAPATAVTLTTPLTSGNGQAGIMFDLVAGPRALVITGAAISLDAGTHTIEVRTRPSTVVGNLTATGWTLIGTVTGVVGGGNGTQTFFDFTDFAMAAGSTTGIYFRATAGTPVNYTNGTLVGAVIASDANLSIRSGFGRAGTFGANFSPRNFNGSIQYLDPVPEPANWALLIAGFGLIGAVARRRRSAVSA